MGGVKWEEPGNGGVKWEEPGRVKGGNGITSCTMLLTTWMSLGYR